MVGILLVNYLPVTSLSGTDKIVAETTGTAAAPVIKKGLDHTSRYIQSSSTYQRGLREYVTAVSPDGGVLSYAWFINTADSYLDGTDNATSGTWGANGTDANGDGNTDYQGSYGTQSSTSNILIATTPETTGIYYTYVEITNTTSGGASTTVRSERAKLDIRNEDKLDKPAAAANVKIAPEFVFPTVTSLPVAGNGYVGARNNTIFGAFDSTLFYTVVGVRTANGWNNSIEGNLQDMNPPIVTGAAQRFSTMEYQRSTYTNNQYVMDTNCVGSSSVYQDISTVPGAIYDVNFEHYSIGDAASAGDVLAATIAPSKFSSDDYASDIPNRYWDGSQGIGSTQGMNNNQGTYFFNIAGDTNNVFVGSQNLATINAGKYPYGLNPGAQNLPATGDPVVQPGILGSKYGTDYFFDMTRYSLLGLYKGDNNKVFQFDLANATNSSYNKTGVVAAASTSAYANTKKVFTYGGENIVQFYSRDNLAQAGQPNNNRKQFYYTVPEGQGATVEAFSSVANTNDANDNGIYNVQFSRISKPEIAVSQDYVGDNAITVSGAKATYAYAIVDVSQGYPQFLDNVAQYTTDATIDTTLGTGNNWFTTTRTTINFTGLGVGRTYRVIAIPQGAIQPETNSNVTPLDVLDTDAWVDTTIAVTSVDGHILSGAYPDGGVDKGRVRIRQANLGNYYALLAVDSTGKPITDTPVVSWVTPDANGEVVFDHLTLVDGANPYVVIAKPQSFFAFDYARATYSPTETYQAGDNIPSGFSEGDPVMIATRVTITNAVTNLALDKSEITRSLGTASDLDNDANTDTVTITCNSTYRGISVFPAGTTAIAFDKALGAGGGLKGSADVSGLSTATFSVPTAGNYDVILQFGDHYDLPIATLAAPDPLVIDYVNENLLTAGATGADAYNTQANVDYRLASGGNDYLGTSATTAVQGSNTQPISLTPALDDTSHPYNADGTLTYTQHIADATRTIGVERTLTVPQRPAALSMGTDSQAVKVDYPAEAVANNSGQAILLSHNNFTTSTAVALSASASFASLSWTGNAALDLASRSDAIADVAFKGRIAHTPIIARPDAPIRQNLTGVGVTITPSGANNMFFANHYGTGKTIQVGGVDKNGAIISGDGLPGEMAASGDLTYTNHQDGNIYNFAFVATQTAPRSKLLEYSTPMLVSSIDFGDVPYGQLGPKTSVTDDSTDFQNNVAKRALTIENTGANAYFLDVQYNSDSPTTGTPMKFDNLGLFGFAGDSGLTAYGDNGNGGSLIFGDFATLVNPNTIASGATDTRFHLILGNVPSAGNWSPNLNRLNTSDTTATNANTTGDINTAPVGLYTTRINLAYSETETAGVLQTPINVSAEVRLNIVKAQWALPMIATQSSKVVSGTDNGLTYSVTKNSLTFDLLLDSEVDASHLQISTNGGVNWVNPDALTFQASPAVGQSIQRVSLTGLAPASTYTVMFRIIDDTNHTQSETVTKTFWTRAAEPTDKNAFVDYYGETLSFTSAYGVTIGGTAQASGAVIKTKFDANQTLELTAKTLASGNYPESEPVEFAYTRQAKPDLTPIGETIYYDGTGQLSGAGSIELRTNSGSYGNSLNQNALYSDNYWARTPATPSAFASEEVNVLLLPQAYHVRVKSAAVVDNSIGASGYTREAAGSLYLMKDSPQDYTTAFTDATFSRIGYNAQTSQALTGAKPFTNGGNSVVATDTASQTALSNQLELFTFFKTNLDSSNNFARIVTWQGHAAPTYTVTIPATMAWTDTDGASNDNQVTISAWDSNSSQRTIPQGSEITVKVAGTNSFALNNAGASLTYHLTLSDTTPLTANSLVQSMTAATADTLGATGTSQGFTTTVSGTPQVSGHFTGAITFDVGLTLPSEE
ncbi:hypothetical protein FACS1894192_08240 [Bacilli bacterium]|nr:hypothetical protein FACS1894192_08240 [Bacilli bacterium]